MLELSVLLRHFVLLIAVTTSFAVARPAHAADVNMSAATRAELEASRPSKMIAEDLKIREQIVAQCGPGRMKRAALNFTKSFLPQYTVFQMAVGLSAGQQMTEDPAYARHFYEHSLLEPSSYVSFGGFMLGNHAAASLLSMLSLTHDPCKILKVNPMATAEELQFVKTSQRIWGALAGPIGMSTGLVASSVVGQALADPNIQLCAGYYLGRPRNDEQRKQAIDGCDKAYDEWVLNAGTKIRNLSPDILSQLVVIGTMAAPKMIHNSIMERARIAAGESVDGAGAYSAAKLETSALKFGLSKSKSLIFRGYTVVVRIGGLAGEIIPSPVLKIGLAVANMWAFLELSNLTSPWFKPMTQIFNGHDIGQTLDEIRGDLTTLANRGFVAPRPPGPPAICSQPAGQYGSHDWEDIRRLDCAPPAVEPTAAKIARLGEQERKYRDFLLGETMTAVANWQDYVLNFTNTYTDAFKLYSIVLHDIRDGHYNKDFKNPLFDPQPLWGVPVKVEYDWSTPGQAWTSGKICDLPPDVLARFDAVVNVLNKEIAKQKLPVSFIPLPKFIDQRKTTSFFGDEHYEVSSLQTIHDGLAAMNCKSTPALSEEQRQQKYNKAISTLFWELNSIPDLPLWKPLNVTPSVPLDSPLYPELAENNLYLRINMVLGGPQPLFPGAGYLKSLNRESAFINQDYKNLHPKIYGSSVNGFATETMTDYLLASMVCGPTADQSILEHSAFDIREQTLADMATSIPGWIAQKAGYAASWIQDKLPFYPKQVGWDLEFVPPRVINPIAPSKENPNGINLCSDFERAKAGISAIDKPYAHYADIDDGNAALDPYLTNIKIGGKVYHGLLDVLKTHANKSIVGGDANTLNFAKWWGTVIDSRVLPLMQKKRQQFATEIVNKRFLPVLNERSYSTDIKVGYKSKGLAKGLTNSIDDSVVNNLWIINMLSLKGMSEAEKAELIKSEKQIAVRIRLALAMSGAAQQIRGAINYYKQNETTLGKVELKNPDDEGKLVRSPLEQQAFDYYAANEQGVNNEISHLYALIAKHVNLQTVQIKRSIVPSLNAAFENLKGLVTEVARFHGVVVSVKLEAGG